MNKQDVEDIRLAIHTPDRHRDYEKRVQLAEKILNREYLLLNKD